MSDSDPISHVSVSLCPHIVGFYRDDIPPEDHIILTAECAVCGTVTATPPHPRPGRPGFSYVPVNPT